MAGKCPVCGAPLQGNRCSYCGYEEKVETNVSSVTPNAQPTVVVNNVIQNNNNNVNGFVNAKLVSDKSKTVALVLCFFLGFFGGHQFYVGNTKKGILYFFTGGLIGIGAFYDFIMICLGKFRDHNGLLLKG